MNLLRLHELATALGDGLHPDLLRVFEERARVDTDPQVVTLKSRVPGMSEQAGPSPSGRAGLFVPGNVLRVVAPAAAPQIAARDIKSA
jgi:hypothetical protein